MTANLITFPDWTQPEDLLYQDLVNLIKKVSNFENTNLLIDITGISQEEAELMFSSVITSLTLEEGLEISDSLGLNFVSEITPDIFSNLQKDNYKIVNLNSSGQNNLNKEYKSVRKHYNLIYEKQGYIPVELAIFDTIHPKTPIIGGFRHAEHSYYLEHFTNSICIHGNSRTYKTWEEIKRAINKYCHFLQKPLWRNKFYVINEVGILKPELAYSLMVNETLNFLPIFEKFKIPFCACITPGGGFFLDNEISDINCRRIVESPSFRYLITTQEIINDYLLKKIPSLKGRSEAIYGGFSQIEANEIKTRPDVCHKKRLDIAFVAYNYGNNGFDKGFDIFCDVVTKSLFSTDSKFRFHIVGNWDYENISFAPKPSQEVIYHGVLSRDELIDLYPYIDIILNPYRLLNDGQFNGFPMSPDGSMCGCALFSTNPLRLKTPYISGQDVVEITENSQDIFDLLIYYDQHRDKLKNLAIKGQEKTLLYRSRTAQAEKRIQIFERLIGHKMERQN
ncbi:glycosyltransferase family protein [Cyanobacterium aponinum]|uniref:Spore protein YkvP/CgeB glycosyl transferase-like domain-containing protein n=1 Tax=Cyanobacterium aponinum (strain PCC 10605) TaxID=755178 RepID=K9Z4J7_CYAAP|nr:glycosyltransferase family 1 protein [Cyanobacterium aponinum]AFZ53308.1 hypothetical protein Cyan10605_1189 [Cyanobacterium aponinum PCC 10605]